MVKTLAPTMIFAGLILIILSGTTNASTIDYDYYQTHSIIGSIDGSLYGYQVYFDIYNSNGTSSGSNVFLNGHSRSWPYDIAFTSSDGNTTYPIWIEASNSSYAKIWVNITNTIPASPSSLPINIWYGKSGDTTKSNPNTTFLWFDDFNGTAINATKWQNIESNGAVTVAGGVLHLSASPIARIESFRTYSSFGVGTAAEFTYKTSHSGDVDCWIYCGYGYGTNSIQIFPAGHGDVNRARVLVNANSGGSSTKAISWSAGVFHRVTLGRLTNSAHLVIDGVATDLSTNYPTTSMNFYVEVTSGGSIVPEMWMEFLAIRKLADNEPGHGAYSSETIKIIADFSASPTFGGVPLTVQFYDQSTGNPTAWEWNFGDGSPNSTNQNPAHTFTAVGSYTITLTAYNSLWYNSTQLVNYIVVGQSSLVAHFSASPTLGAVPLTVQFYDQSAGDPTAWAWNFGDGSPNSTNQNPAHTFTAVGSYTITLTVSKANESHTNQRVGYVVTMLYPIAGFTYSPAVGLPPLSVQFTDTSAGVIRSRLWNFGDGLTSTSQTPSHTYFRPGTYTVTLVVSNEIGSSTAVNYEVVIAYDNDNGDGYADGVTGGFANRSMRLPFFTDHLFTDLLDQLFPNNTDNIKPDQAVYTITKPFYMHGVGNWWIVIVLLTMAGIYWLSHNGSPFLIIVLFMIGNGVLWAFLPMDWLSTIAIMCLFSLALMIVTAIRGRG